MANVRYSRRMALVLVMASLAAGLLVGFVFGHGNGVLRSKEGRTAARYRDAIALCRDLIKTPDALDLRDRAQKIIAAHEAANPAKEN